MAAATWVVALMAAGTAAQTYTTIQSGKAAEKAAESEASWQEYNAKVTDQQRKAAEEQASETAKLQRKQAKKLQGENLSLLAESGSMFSGSQLDMLTQNASNMEVDINNTFASGTNVAGQFNSQAIMERGMAKLTRIRGKNAKTAAYWQAGSTLLSGAGQATYMGATM